mgnify:CR=1 FL=1
MHIVFIWNHMLRICIYLSFSVSNHCTLPVLDKGHCHWNCPSTTLTRSAHAKNHHMSLTIMSQNFSVIVSKHRTCCLGF